MCIMKYIASLLITLSFLFSSCIEEYQMPNFASGGFQSELVVQGYILSGEESVVYLSRTEPVYNEVSPLPIKNAKINIIGQNGYESEQAEYNDEDDYYIIKAETLPSNSLYALRIELDEEVYQSEFAAIIESPEIDEISYKEQEDGISIHLSTYADDNESRYYMWGYEEDWEFHASVNLLVPQEGVFIYNKNNYVFENTKINPYYYCWGHRKSSNIHIYNTSNLQENTVKDKRLLNIPVDDIRISYIYSILVKQWSLTPEAYTYFHTLEKMTENSGGLFQVMPSELRGNVYCISNPNIKVRGYITTANVKTKRMFIHASQFTNVFPTYDNCSLMFPPNPSYSGWQMSWMDQVNYYGAVVLSKLGNIDNNSILYSNTCVDCTQTKGATKKRPDFWPNNHE